MRAQRVLSEIGIGLRRNLAMTVAVVVTVAISLALFGSALMLNTQVNVMKGFWYDKVEVAVYLCGTSSIAANCNGAPVSADERNALLADLKETPEVKDVFYESQAAAYEQFKRTFKDSPDLVDSVGPEALPESFRVKLKDPTRFEVIASAFKNRPGVDEVQDQKELLAPFFRVLDRVKWGAAAVAVIQILAAILLISNTIRLSAFGRRRETGIMRLVGASNFYIRLPFLLEGMLAGLLGSLFAVGGIAAVQKVLVEGLLRPVLPVALIGWSDVFRIAPILVVTGALVAGLSSFVTLQRHLRV